MANLPVRKNIRLKEYDYSQTGCYFITMCIKQRHEVLWDPANVGARIARPLLSNIGDIVDKAIVNIPHIYESIKVDNHVIMPNHIHMIMTTENNHGRAMRAPTVSTVINQTKGYITKQVGYTIWQKLFHDHIIRDENEYLKIWKYIDENPMKWQEDCYYVKMSLFRHDPVD